MAERYTRRFALVRKRDVSGVSGVGTVADGVEFPDGIVVLRWRGRRRSTAIYQTLDDMLNIHGHGGSTNVQWKD